MSAGGASLSWMPVRVAVMASSRAASPVELSSLARVMRPESQVEHDAVSRTTRAFAEAIDAAAPDGADKDAAAAIGKLIAERAIEKGVKDVVFDRGGYIYHGRVKALADAAREAGLNF